MLIEFPKSRASSESLVHQYCELVFRFRWPIIVTYFLLACVAAWFVTNIRTTTDNRVFFGPANPELLAFQALEKTYSENNDVLIAVAPAAGDVFAPETLKAIAWLTDQLWAAPFATRVDSLVNHQHSYAEGDQIVIRDLVPRDFSYSPREIAAVRRLALNEPALRGLLIAPDATVAGVAVNFRFPREEPESIDRIVAYLDGIEREVESAHPSLTLHLTGNTMLMHAFGEAQKRDMATIVPLMMAVMAVILYVLIRSWAATAIALAVSLLSTVFAMGFAGATGIVLNAGSGPAPFIVLTVAIAYAVHVITQFMDDRRAGASNRVAVINVVENHGFPIFLAGVTTAIGFLSMNASDAPPFHDLGNISAIGVAVAFVVSLTLLPALLHVVPVTATKSRDFIGGVMKSLSGIVVRNPKRILFVALVSIGLLGWGATRMAPSENWIEYFGESFEFRRDTDFVLGKLSGFDIVEFSVPAKGENGIDDPAYLRKLDDFTAWLRAQPEVSNVISVSDVIRRLHRNLHDDDPAFDRVPDDRKQAAQYFLLYEMSLPPGLSLTDRISVPRSATRVTVVLRKDGRNLPSDELIPFTERMEAWLRAHGEANASAKGTGLSIMFAHLSARNIETMLGGTTLAIVIVSIILIVGMQSVKLGVVSLGADLVPALMSFGMWGYLVGEINMAVSVVAAMTFGVVVDDTIHYLTKYAKGRRTLGMTPAQAVDFAFTSVGKAMVFTTIIMSLGFLILGASSFGVNSSLGVLTAATFVWAVIADLFLLAPLLLICDREFKLFSWQQVQCAVYGAEPVSLQRRVDAYFERMRDGHVVVGRIPGPDAVELWSNDYLALNAHPAIVEAQTVALSRGDTDSYMSAALKATDEQRALEREMAAFVGAEAAALCQSGWCANAGLIQALAEPGTPVYLDQFAHASLWEGARASGAAVYAFPHNQPSRLEAQIRRHGPGVVAVDAIYSSDGTICPLAEIAATCERHDSILVVDESHALGVYGARGEGLVYELGLCNKVHYRTFSLSKAFVTRAGMVAGPERVMSYFPYEARPTIFSSAVLPYEVAGLAATLRVVQEEGWRREKLRQNTRILRERLRVLGYAVERCSSQVIALHSGTERQTVALRDALEARGIFGAVFCAPATPKNHALVRLSVNAGLSRQDLERVVAACKHVVDTRLIAPWPKHLLARDAQDADRGRGEHELASPVPDVSSATA